MRVTASLLLFATAALAADPDWNQVNPETLRHFSALVRVDSSGAPNLEAPVVEYLKRVLEAEGIPVRVFAKDPQRPNLVARIKEPHDFIGEWIKRGDPVAFVIVAE